MSRFTDPLTGADAVGDPTAPELGGGEFSGAGDAQANDSDTVEGTSVSGHVEGGIDSYVITGEFTDFQVIGDPTVRVEDDVVDPETLGVEHDLPHEFVVTGTEQKSSYLVETTGSVAKRDGMWGAEADDTASGNTASGTVTDDRDTFGFSGRIARMGVDGTATITFGG